MAGRPPGSPNKEKPFKDALRLEAALLEKGEPSPAPKGSLRYIARELLLRACADTPTAREVADRLDGKPAQAIVGDDDADAIKVVQRIERVIVDPSNSNG